jgi:hypothetical protein
LVPSACCRRTLAWTGLTTPERRSISGEQSDAWQYLKSGKEVLWAVQLRTHTRPCGWRGSLRGLETQGHASEGKSVVPAGCAGLRRHLQTEQLSNTNSKSGWHTKM